MTTEAIKAKEIQAMYYKLDELALEDARRALFESGMENFHPAVAALLHVMNSAACAYGSIVDDMGVSPKEKAEALGIMYHMLGSLMQTTLSKMEKYDGGDVADIVLAASDKFNSKEVM
jgi:hypothetical protein